MLPALKLMIHLAGNQQWIKCSDNSFAQLRELRVLISWSADCGKSQFVDDLEDCGLEDLGFESIWFALCYSAALAAETFAGLC